MIAERYTNTINVGGPCDVIRFWVTDRIMVGGSIVDENDGDHLRRDFGITHVVSCETENDDAWIGNWTDARFPDVGAPIQASIVARVLALPFDAVYYVHCQQGRNRSPAIAAAMAFSFYRDAMSRIRSVLPEFPVMRAVPYLDSFAANLGANWWRQ